MRISDLIAHYIKNELEKKEGTILLSRNELAEQFNCVPSQINYVIMTRFSPEHGYYVDSRRGGGGYIKITRIKIDGDLLIMHVINSIGNGIDQASANALISNLRENSVISGEAALLIAAAVSDKVLAAAHREQRNEIRAAILKRCLLILA